jgi:hypothetical protein
MWEAQVVDTFLVQKLSFTAMGIPSNNDNFFPDLYLSVESSACCLASAGVRVVNILYFSFSFLMSLSSSVSRFDGVRFCFSNSREIFKI